MNKGARHTSSHADPLYGIHRARRKRASANQACSLCKVRGNNSLDKARVQAGDEQDARMSGWRRDRQRRLSRPQKIPPDHA